MVTCCNKTAIGGPHVVTCAAMQRQKGGGAPWLLARQQQLRLAQVHRALPSFFVATSVGCEGGGTCASARGCSRASLSTQLESDFALKSSFTTQQSKVPCKQDCTATFFTAALALAEAEGMLQHVASSDAQLDERSPWFEACIKH